MVRLTRGDLDICLKFSMPSISHIVSEEAFFAADTQIWDKLLDQVYRQVYFRGDKKESL